MSLDLGEIPIGFSKQLLCKLVFSMVAMDFPFCTVLIFCLDPLYLMLLSSGTVFLMT